MCWWGTCSRSPTGSTRAGSIEADAGRRAGAGRRGALAASGGRAPRRPRPREPSGTGAARGRRADAGRRQRACARASHGRSTALRSPSTASPTSRTPRRAPRRDPQVEPEPAATSRDDAATSVEALLVTHPVREPRGEDPRRLVEDAPPPFGIPNQMVLARSRPRRPREAAVLASRSQSWRARRSSCAACEPVADRSTGSACVGVPRAPAMRAAGSRRASRRARLLGGAIIASVAACAPS